MNKLFPAVLAVLAASLILVSCISYEIDETADFGEVYDFRGVKILTDNGADAMVAAVLRNDNPFEVQISYRAIGGEIGNRINSSNWSIPPSSNGRYMASWLHSDTIGTLQPGEEILVSSFIRNWYVANKPFRSRMEVVISGPGTPARLTIEFDQDVVFTDATTIFQQNRMGRNDPGRYNARAGRFGELPRNYELTIPE